MIHNYRGSGFILKSINNKIEASDIKLAPGSQMRHDRWQAMVSQESVDLIPARFVLKGLGPENEDLNIELFVEGKKSPPPILTNRNNSQQHQK